MGERWGCVSKYLCINCLAVIVFVTGANVARAQVLKISQAPPASPAVTAPPPDGTNPTPPITCNGIALDSNSPENLNHPHQFLAGARVCNTSGATATDLVATFKWDQTDPDGCPGVSDACFTLGGVCSPSATTCSLPAVSL